ncbi:MAG TPA: acyl-ACP--UDP-N-acetylglucosamine O-acyltransferase [Candidatus Omnitrophota bacterium]|nr:acyl-ACP--UDP-N-acetylglucosamine O-acyltransferase [Candidatus Omnitrophota bacterium]
MNEIHSSAVVGKNVKLGAGNRIGPNVVMEDGVEIGNGNVFYPNAYVASGTQMGNENEIHMGAVIGHVPQDLAFDKNAKTFTRIGNQNVFREYVTIHRGTKEGSATVIGNNNYLMANAHVAHNCQLGNRIIMVNLASLTGYCVVEDQAFISGMVGFHQFTRVGRLAIVSALSAANKDIPPFTMCGGRPARAQGLNSVGLRRAGISPASRSELKKAFRLLYREGLSVGHACEQIEKELHSEEVKHLLGFIRASKRGIVAARDLAVEMKGGEDIDDADDGA